MQSTVVNQVTILFIIMGIGFIAKKRNIIDDAAGKKLSELLLMVTAPAMILSSFQFDYSSEMLKNVFLVLGFAFAAHIVSLLLGILLYRRYPENIRKVLKFITIFTNCGFMGFPLLESLYGKTGVFYGSIYVAVYNLFVWTIGVMIFSGERDLKSIRKAMLNPGTIAVFIGMFLFVFSLKLPYPVAKALDMTGAMTAPLAMLIVGSILAGVDLKSLFSGFPMYYGIAVRNILLPLAAVFILRAFGFSGVVYGVCVSVIAMPAGANTPIFAELYGGDSFFASKTVAFSTLFSIISIPLILMLA
ncbi:MAG TPA: AEC family transporter [Clostridia bacterium]|nr:AEC family transporter [Clostridia bacterium]